MVGCGLILEWGSWRATFVATAILAAVVFAAAVALAPNTADPDEAVIDLPGFLLSGHRHRRTRLRDRRRCRSGMDAPRGPRSAWRSPLLALGRLRRVGAAHATADARRAALPPPGLQHREPSPSPCSSSACSGSSSSGLQFLQLILGYSALKSALGLLPMATDRHADVEGRHRTSSNGSGQRAVMTIGPRGLGAGLVVMSTPRRPSHLLALPRRPGAFGLGMALTSTPSTTAIVTSLPPASRASPRR